MNSEVTAVLTGTMDVVYENSLSAIEGLQARFHQQSSVFFMISNVFDPRYAFLFYSPLFFSLDWNIGKKIMWVTVIAEWSNQVLKWMLHGERPYWWVHETQVYNKTGVTTPDIQQYFLTCETGPGSPSGHSMVTAAVWYVILSSYLQKFNFTTKDSKTVIAKLCWLAYVALLTTVGASRVFIAAHFPHQCLIGFAIGCMVAIAMDNINRHHLNTFHYCLVTVGLIGSALTTYAFLKAIGINPMWSIDRAVKWCAKPEYIHLDTTPFFSMMRYCGFMLGMGFGFNSAAFRRLLQKGQHRFGWGARILCAVLAVGMCKLSEKVDLPKENMTVFYVLAFLMNTALSYAMIAVIPALVAKLTPTEKRKVQ